MRARKVIDEIMGERAAKRTDLVIVKDENDNPVFDRDEVIALISDMVPSWVRYAYLVDIGNDDGAAVVVADVSLDNLEVCHVAKFYAPGFDCEPDDVEVLPQIRGRTQSS